MIPICDVYLYEDRAQIVRRATLSLDEGANSLVLRDLSPLVVHKSVQISLSNKQARVNFVDNRVVVVEDDTIDRTRPEEAESMLAEETSAKLHMNQQKLIFEQYRELHRRLVQEIFVAASWGQGKKQEWQEKEAVSRTQKDKAFAQYQEAWTEYTKIKQRNRDRNVSGHIALRTQKKGRMYSDTSLYVLSF